MEEHGEERRWALSAEETGEETRGEEMGVLMGEETIGEEMGMPKREDMCSGAALEFQTRLCKLFSYTN